MSDGVFRSKAGFTAVGNVIVRDKAISLKAKGLYLVIQSHITMPNMNCTKSYFQNMVAEGKKAFESTWQELKERGYLKVHIRPNGKNDCQFAVEYELLDEPKDGAHTFYYNAQGAVTRTNLSNDKTEKSEKSRISQNGSNANGNNANGSTADRTNADGSTANGGNNNKTDDKTENNNIKSIHQSEIDRLTEKYSKEDVLLFMNLEFGIPYEFCNTFQKYNLTQCVHALMQWDYYMANSVLTPTEKNIFMLLSECLIEMLFDDGVNSYANEKVTKKDVWRAVNQCLQQEEISEGALDLFVRLTIEQFIEISREKKIKNVKKYLKSLAWNKLKTYRVDFAADMERLENEK